MTDDESPIGGHEYLSTGCFHGEHGYCQAMTGLAGAKRPARCKFCDAPCVCPCHETNTGPPLASRDRPLTGRAITETEAQLGEVSTVTGWRPLAADELAARRLAT